MSDRREIILDSENVTAAAQILAWIALPHRPQSGVDLLNNWFWARRRHRREPVPDLPFDLKKPNRLGPQLETFRQRTLTAFRAGMWFETKTMSGPNRPAIFSGFDVSTRHLAYKRAGLRDTAPANEIRDVWSRRKSVAHLAAGAGNAIAQVHAARGVPGFDLEMTLFDPVWVEEAISQSESRARAASLLGAFDLSKLHHFHRDTF